MLARSSFMRHQVAKGVAARLLSTNSARADATVFTNPMLRTNVPNTASFTAPVTASPAYDIKESPLHYAVSVNVPQDIKPGNLTIEIEQGGKAMRIRGDSENANFSKRFAWGGILDVDRLETSFKAGFLSVQAPKIHYLNGNSVYNLA